MLLLIGGGKMGGALVGGLLAKAVDVEVVEPDASRRAALAATHPDLVLHPSLPAAVGARSNEVRDLLLAVKPDVAEGVLRGLPGAGSAAWRVLSIVAGLSTARLEDCLPPASVVVRAMPNTPALVGAGVTAIAGGAHVTAADLDWAEGVLAAVGIVVRVPERHLDAVTGLSGSGPAYVFLMAEALVEAGVLVGLTRELATTLVVETLLGSAKLLAETGESPESLRAAVTSPGGTTAAALRTLESRGVRSALLEAVAAATERSRNLAR